MVGPGVRQINHCAQFSGRFFSISWWSFCDINLLASCRLECSLGGIRQYASNKLFSLWVNCPFHTSPRQVNPLFYSWKLNLYQPAWWSGWIQVVWYSCLLPAWWSTRRQNRGKRLTMVSSWGSRGSRARSTRTSSASFPSPWLSSSPFSSSTSSASKTTFK